MLVFVVPASDALQMRASTVVAPRGGSARMAMEEAAKAKFLATSPFPAWGPKSDAAAAPVEAAPWHPAGEVATAAVSASAEDAAKAKRPCMSQKREGRSAKHSQRERPTATRAHTALEGQPTPSTWRLAAHPRHERMWSRS